MNTKFLSFFMLCCTFFMQDIRANEPWRLNLSSQVEEGINLRLDLYEESIDVPGMEMFGPMNGYMNRKGIYGVWMITSFKIESEREAILRLSNDQGSETQSVRLTTLSDSTYQAELQGGVVMKKVEGKKLVKLPSRLTFVIKK